MNPSEEAEQLKEARDEQNKKGTQSQGCSAVSTASCLSATFPNGKLVPGVCLQWPPRSSCTYLTCKQVM